MSLVAENKRFFAVSNWTYVWEIKRTECISGFMSISDFMKTYQNITSGFQPQILLIYYTLNKTLPPKTVLSLNWSFRKLEVEMVQYANDILEKRKCSETLRIASPVIWPTALMIKILSFRVNFFFAQSQINWDMLSIFAVFFILTITSFSYLYIFTPGG